MVEEEEQVGRHMIHDVDESLVALIRVEALGGTTEVEIELDTPTGDWVARRNAPTVSVYLYDISEAEAARVSGQHEFRDDDGRIIARRDLPRQFEMSYMVTAWAQRPKDEHRLLSVMLGAFTRLRTIPRSALTETLKALPRGAVRLTVGAKSKNGPSVGEIWSGLGSPAKPSIFATITAPLDAGISAPVAPLVLESPRIVIPKLDESRQIRPDDEHELRENIDGTDTSGQRTPSAAEVGRPGVEETIYGDKKRMQGRRFTVRTIDRDPS